jgi:putative addiction module killer protein
MNVNYTVETTDHFDKWLRKLKDRSGRIAIIERITKIQSTGHFGDFKAISSDLHELRLFIGPGYRVYYTIRQGKLIILLAGGAKNTQSRDIEKAQTLLKNLI